MFITFFYFKNSQVPSILFQQPTGGLEPKSLIKLIVQFWWIGENSSSSFDAVLKVESQFASFGIGQVKPWDIVGIQH